MKLTFFLAFVFLFNTYGSTYSQGKTFSMNIEGKTLREVFRILEDESEFRFFYNENFRDIDREINLTVKNENIESILQKIFTNSEITFQVFNNNLVVLTPRSIAQEVTISGSVTDINGHPLPGVNIVEKGTTNGTVTNLDGEYSISVSSPDAILSFSYVGYLTEEVEVANQSTIDLTLVEDIQALEEVVVVGYGTQKKVNLTGAVSQISSEKLENRPITSSGQGLQGLIPNLNITFRNGDPTTPADFNIRGFESINGGKPLILVDGVPMDLELVNPNDIASVTVLKDASASAVYGARAAFGVILVETKKGQTGKINITLSTEQSLAKPIIFVDPVTDPYEFVTAWNEANMRTNGVPTYDDGYIEGTKAWSENPTNENAWKVVDGELRFYGNNDYKNKLITDFAPQQKYDMTLSSSSKNSSYYISFGYLNKDGYLRNSEKNEKFKRYNALMKAEFSLTDWLSLEEKIIFNSQYSNKPHFYDWDVNINTIARVNPIIPIQFPDLPYYIEQGDRENYEQYIGMYFGGTNFFPYLENGGRITFSTNDLWLTQGFKLNPIKGLTIKGDFTYNTYSKKYEDVASKVDVVTTTDLLSSHMIDNGFSANDYISNSYDYNQYYVFNTYAEYLMDQFTDHHLKIMVGFNQEWGKNQYSKLQANTLITPTITDINATTGSQQTWGAKSHVSLQGVFYRLNYIYKNKYLLEANGRYDGTSRFPKDSRFGFFPSVSVGWRLSHEPFMDGTRKWLDNLKIRASYGELGNQLLVDNDGQPIYYPYIPTMESGMSSYIMSSGTTPFIAAAGLVSPTLTWETVATQNIGLDINISQRLDISFDTYIRDTKDMLMDVVYPDLLGTDAPKQNAADLRTKGWELSMTWHDKIGQDWKYGLNLSLSDNKSEITKFENPTGAISEYYVGQEIGEIWGYVTEGIFQTNEEVAAHADQAQLGTDWRAGDMKYTDLNGDGVINSGSNTLDTPGDRRIIGNSTPRYSFGINTDLSYKNWTLNIFFQGLLKRDYLPPGDSNWQAFYPFKSSYLEKYYLTETWSEDNPNAYFAAPHISSNNHKNTIDQSRYVQNAAYIRLKNLTLNYNLPSEWVNKAGMSRVQVYFSGMNLWEYTRMHKPLDPESVYTLTQEYWKQRIFTLGIKATL